MAPRLGRTSAATAAFAAFALAAAGCGSSEPTDAATGTEGGGPIAVVASTNVYGAIATAIGGDLVEVTSIVDDPGTDPHAYESTPADATTVTEADLVIGNGGGYDPFIGQLVEATGGEQRFIDVYELSGVEEAAPAEGEDVHEGEGEDAHAGEGEDAHAGEGEDAHGSANEHVWYSMPAIALLAGELATALGEISPDDAETFTANAEAFTGQLDGLTERIEAVEAAHGGTRVAATEPLPVYLLQDAGLTDVTPEEFAEATEEGNDPSAAALAEMLELVEGADPVEVLVLNVQTQSTVTDRVIAAAETSGIPIVQMSETLPEGTTEFVAWMDGQIGELETALGGS